MLYWLIDQRLSDQVNYPAEMLMNSEIRTKTSTVRKEFRNFPRRKLDGDHENEKYYIQHAKVHKTKQSDCENI